jgi:hypothetical protein
MHSHLDVSALTAVIVAVLALVTVVWLAVVAQSYMYAAMIAVKIWLLLQSKAAAQMTCISCEHKVHL